MTLQICSKQHSSWQLLSHKSNMLSLTTGNSSISSISISSLSVWFTSQQLCIARSVIKQKKIKCVVSAHRLKCPKYFRVLLTNAILKWCFIKSFNMKYLCNVIFFACLEEEVFVSPVLSEQFFLILNFLEWLSFLGKCQFEIFWRRDFWDTGKI